MKGCKFNLKKKRLQVDLFPGKVLVLTMLTFCFFIPYAMGQKLKTENVSINVNFDYHPPKAFKTMMTARAWSPVNFAVDKEQEVAVWFAANGFIYLYKNGQAMDSVYLNYDFNALMYFNDRDELLCVKQDTIFNIDFKQHHETMLPNSKASDYYSELNTHYREFFNKPVVGYSVNRDLFEHQLPPDDQYSRIYKLFMNKRSVFSGTDGVVYKYNLDSLGTEGNNYVSMKVINDFNLVNSRLIYVVDDFSYLFYEADRTLYFRDLAHWKIQKIATNISDNVSFKLVPGQHKIYCLDYGQSKGNKVVFKVVSW